MSGGSSLREVDAMTSLVRAVPGADPILAEHVADHGEILSHLLMADLRRFYVDSVESGDADRVAKFLDAVEVLANSDDERVRNVVEVSFIEDLVLGEDGRRRSPSRRCDP